MSESEDYDNRTAIRETVFCPDCGYNLRGLTGDVCPECGSSLAAMRLADAQIPWLQRRDKGWFNAYWKTVLFVMFRQRELRYEMARDISYSDAQRFRWITILHAIVPVAILAIFACRFVDPCQRAATSGFLRGFPPCPTVTHWFHGAGWAIAVYVTAFVLALTVATGAARYFVQPRNMPVHLQDRAIALSYYASAPLAWTFLPVTIGLVGWAVQSRHEDYATGLILFAIALVLFELGVWWSDTTLLIRRILPRYRHCVWLAGFGLPVLWGVIFGVIFGLTTLVNVYIVVIVETLTP